MHLLRRAPLPCCLLALALAGCPPVDIAEQQRCGWTQWGQGPQHQGQACVAGQPPDRLLARVAYDPFSAAETLENATPDEPGTLTIHYPTPLLVDDEVYLVVKGGHFVPCEPPGSGSLADGGVCGLDAREGLTWSVKAYRWQGDALTERWTYLTDWKPVGRDIAFWEPPLQPAVGGDFLWVPGAGGTLDQVRRSDGARVRRVDPFPDAGAFAVSGVAVGHRGEVYQGVLWEPGFYPGVGTVTFPGALVQVAADGGVTTAGYDALVPDAPGPFGTCYGAYSTRTSARPFPPVTDAGVVKPTPRVGCSPQRPQVGAVPAVGPDGTVYLVSRDFYNGRYGYLVAVNPDLTPRWSASLRDRLQDGCGVTVPLNPATLPGDAGPNLAWCRGGTTVGVDPFTNQPPAGQVLDQGSSSPVVLPDGTVAYGAYTGYNNARGHLLRFSGDGGYLGAYDFGWDLTPAVWTHDGTYSVVVKDNHYSNFTTVGAPETYFLTRLSPDLTAEWWFQSTNTFSCAEDGGCVSDHPYGFEWCISAPAVDGVGNVYGNAEDGNLYVIGADGGEQARRFLKLAIGAAYTPIALDAKGRIYALNGGDLFVLGR